MKQKTTTISSRCYRCNGKKLVKEKSAFDKKIKGLCIRNCPTCKGSGIFSEKFYIISGNGIAIDSDTGG